MDRNVYLTRINGLKDVCLVAEDDGFPVNWDVFTVLVDDNGFDVCEGLSDTDQQFMNRLSALINHLNAILGHTLLPIPGINFLKSVNNILRYLITHIKIIYDIHFEEDNTDTNDDDDDDDGDDGDNQDAAAMEVNVLMIHSGGDVSRIESNINFGISQSEIFGLVKAQTKVVEGYRMELNVETPEAVVDLINQHCWDADPETRWTVNQVARELEKITGSTPPVANRDLNNLAVSKKKEKPIEQGTVENDVTKECTVDNNTIDCTKEEATPTVAGIATPTIVGTAPNTAVTNQTVQVQATQQLDPSPQVTPPPTSPGDEKEEKKEEKKEKKSTKSTPRKKASKNTTCDETKEDSKEKDTKKDKKSEKKEESRKKNSSKRKTEATKGKSAEKRKSAAPRKKNTKGGK